MNTNWVIKLSQSSGLLPFEDSTPFIIFACCVRSQLTERRGRGEAEWPLTLSLRGAWPEAEPAVSFTPCFMFVLYYYGPWIGYLHPTEFTLSYRECF